MERLEREKKHQWHRWKYEHRLAVVKEVDKLKKQLSKGKMSETSKRNRITTCIGNNSSRQEFIPLLGRVIDRAHVETLHLKNNLCALLHRRFLETVLKLSNTHGFSSFEQVPSKSLFAQYVRTLSQKCDLHRLSKKLIKWFNDNEVRIRQLTTDLLVSTHVQMQTSRRIVMQGITFMLLLFYV